MKKPSIAVRLLLATLHMLATTLLAIWSILTLQEMQFVYSDNEVLEVLQLTFVWGWQALTALCPVWILAPAIFIVVWDYPYSDKHVYGK